MITEFVCMSVCPSVCVRDCASVCRVNWSFRQQKARLSVCSSVRLCARARVSMPTTRLIVFGGRDTRALGESIFNWPAQRQQSEQQRARSTRVVAAKSGDQNASAGQWRNGNGIGNRDGEAKRRACRPIQRRNPYSVRARVCEASDQIRSN